jgi:CrcB protein
MEDSDEHPDTQRRRQRPDPRTGGSSGPSAVLAAIALGGGLGGLARHGLALALPTHPGRVPWGTLTANVLGCLLIGVLMVLITEVWSPHRLVRPFLGVGLLGGFTTFSTYAVEIRGLFVAGSAPLALGYLAGTLLSCLLATLTAVILTRLVTRSARRRLRRRQ